MNKALKLIAVAACALTATTVAASGSPASLQPVVTGTAHQALFSIAFRGDLGVAVGAGGQLMESHDAGKSWKVVTPVLTPLALLGVGMAPGHAIIVGQVGMVFVMSDDGQWQKMDSGTKHRLFNVAVKSDGVAVAVGAYGTILRSTDGGKTWTSIAPSWTGYTKYGDQPHLYAVNVDDSGTITVAGELGLILRSSDAGKTWQTLHKGNEETSEGVSSLFAMQLNPDGTGYVVGQNGTILHTSDHGDTWTQLDSGTQSILLGVHADGAGNVIATGMHDMLISRDRGKTWRHIVGQQVTSSWLEGVTSPGPGQAPLAVGEAGRVVRITDG